MLVQDAAGHATTTLIYTYFLYTSSVELEVISCIYMQACFSGLGSIYVEIEIISNYILAL